VGACCAAHAFATHSCSIGIAIAIASLNALDAAGS
jgi:hypothetical protein